MTQTLTTAWILSNTPHFIPELQVPTVAYEAVTKVRGKVSGDRRLWANLHMLQASSLLRIRSSSIPSASDTLVPIKAKIFLIISHLCCPSFFPPSLNKPHNKERESYTSHTRRGRFLPLRPLSYGYFKERDDHPVRLLDLSLPAEILLK